MKMSKNDETLLELVSSPFYEPEMCEYLFIDEELEEEEYYEDELEEE